MQRRTAIMTTWRRTTPRSHVASSGSNDCDPRVQKTGECKEEALDLLVRDESQKKKTAANERSRFKERERLID
jgi:hypothetical protein